MTAIQLGHPWWLSSKESTCNAEDMGEAGSVPGSGRSPGRGNDSPLQYSYLGKSHGQRCLVGYGPRDHKESDMTDN